MENMGCIDVRFRQIPKNLSADFEQQNTWNVIFGIPWHIFYKTYYFEENRAFFWLKPTIPDRFQTQNVRETQYWRFRCVRSVKFVKKRRFVYRNTCKITVPAGLAWHVRGEKCKALWRIWCIDVRFRQIPKNQSADFEQQNTWNVIFGIPRHIFYRNVQFLKKIARFWLKPTIPDRFQTQNVRETQCWRFRCVRSVKFLKNTDLCTKAPVKKTLPAGLAQHVL